MPLQRDVAQPSLTLPPIHPSPRGVSASDLLCARSSSCLSERNPSDGFEDLSRPVTKGKARRIWNFEPVLEVMALRLCSHWLSAWAVAHTVHVKGVCTDLCQSRLACWSLGLFFRLLKQRKAKWRVSLTQEWDGFCCGWTSKEFRISRPCTINITWSMSRFFWTTTFPKHLNK